MATNDPRVRIYLNALLNQGGGFTGPEYIPVFRGAQLIGGGFGDVLRGVWRTVFPIAVRGLANFLTGVSHAQAQGADFNSATKNAGIEAGTRVSQDVATSLSNKIRQRGKGKKRHSSSKQVYKGSKCLKVNHVPPKLNF